MQVKVVMTYNIRPERDQEYFEFLVRELAPGLSRLGLQPTESWYTTYGNRPKIMMGGIVEDFETAKALLQNPEWQALYESLQGFISDFRARIIRVTPYFPIV
ncbi:MAG: hypothetical protein OHK0023_23290 [Anaerolineae bacterium]